MRNWSKDDFEQIARFTEVVDVFGDHALIKIFNRYEMFVDKSDESIGTYLFRGYAWESWISAWIARTVQPGWTCIDVGANQGYFTFMLLDLVGPTGKVIAFEPNPEYVNLITSTRLRNPHPNLQFSSLALSDEIGTATLSVPGNLKGSASIVQKFDDSYGPEVSYEIHTNTLDNVGPEKFDFIKIDIEGAEQKFWEGSKVLRAKNPDAIILMEWEHSRFDDSFADELNKYQLSYINTDSNEVPVDGEWLKRAGLEMVVVKNAVS